MKNSGLIKKLIFELGFTAQKENFLLPEMAKENFYNRILPVIEKVFAAVPDNISIRIEQLEINAGEVNMDDLISFLEKTLQQKLQEETDKQKNSFVKKNKEITAYHVTEKNTAAYMDDICSLFIYFLKTGLLPWYQSRPVSSDTEALIGSVKSLSGKKFKNLLTYQNTLNRFKNELKTVLLTQNGRQRLINSFQAADIFGLMLILQPVPAEKSISSTLQLLNLIKKRAHGYNWYQSFMDILIVSLVDNNELQTSGNISNGLQLQHLVNSNEFAALLKEYIRKAASNTELATMKKLFSEEKIIGAGSLFHKSTDTITTAPDHKKLSVIPNDQEITQELESAATEGITVSNAGLIILSPFLPYFFNEMGLMKEGVFKDLRAAVKAVQLLHYIVYESSKTPEYMLPLNKVLCGVDISTPVPASFTVTKKLKQERQTMLEIVIQRWAALGNTSVAGLNNTFLKRNGMLYKKENDWLLKPEPASFDMLLDKLPWNINFIKLKWAGYNLHTEWNNT